MKLKVTGNSALQTVSTTNIKFPGTDIGTYKKNCYNLQSMAVVGSKAYVVKVNKYGNDPNNMTTDDGEIHIFPNYTESKHTIIGMGNNILGHANDAAYYNGALYVAVSSKGRAESHEIVKVVLNASETTAVTKQGYTLYDAAAKKAITNVSVRGISHYQGNTFIIMLNPKAGVEYTGSANKFGYMQFKIGTFNEELKRFEFTYTFFAKNTGREITQSISYSSVNKKLYIVTCNKQIEVDNKVEVFMTHNTVIELDFERSKLSRKTFGGTAYDYFVPSNSIVLDRLSTEQKIFEMQACCVDENSRRLVYAVDRKYEASGSRVQGEIYMVNNLYTKL